MCLGLPGLLSDFGLVWSSSISIELIGFLVYIGISLNMIFYTYLSTQLTNSTTQMKLCNLIDTSSWITSVLPIMLGLVPGGPAKRVACNNTCYSSYFLGGHNPFSFPSVMLCFVGSVYYALLTHILFDFIISNFKLSLLMHIFIIAFKFNSSKVSSFYGFHQVSQVSHTRSLRLWQYCRHEPPVMSWDVSILQKEPEVLTVCKPASVPVSQYTDSQGLMQFP